MSVPFPEVDLSSGRGSPRLVHYLLSLLFGAEEGESAPPVLRERADNLIDDKIGRADDEAAKHDPASFGRRVAQLASIHERGDGRLREMNLASPISNKSHTTRPAQCGHSES